MISTKTAESFEGFSDEYLSSLDHDNLKTLYALTMLAFSIAEEDGEASRMNETELLLSQISGYINRN